MAYENFKDLARRTASDNVLLGKTFDIDKNPKYKRYQPGLNLLVHKRIDKSLLALILQVVLLHVHSQRT